VGRDETGGVDLAKLVGRPPMRPGEARLPWDDPVFSERMLAEHLELSTFAIDDVRLVLGRVARHLLPEGRAVIELSTESGVHAKGERPATWYVATGGLFAAGDHLVLRESRWFADAAASVERWWVLDDAASEPTMFGSSTWWHGSALDDAITAAGLDVEIRVGDLTGAAPADGDDFETLVLRQR
jgi:hypothetical protein